MAPRRNSRTMVGNTRMDAALDAMRQFGFEDKLVRETVQKLLDVYDGIQGWPFIEEGSYKLLIETILCAEDKDDAIKEGVGETSLTATPATGTTGTTERRKRTSRWDERPDGVGETSSAAFPATGTTGTTERRKRKSRWDERPDDV